MSNDLYAQGELRIEPKLPDGAFKRLGLTPDEGDNVLYGEQFANEDVQLVDGEIKVVGSSWTTVHAPDEGYRGELDVEAIVKSAKRNGCTVNGVITIFGEDSLDVSRIRVEDNVVHHESPKLVWPNGDEQQL